jgi:SAM-dependent methyltransferase
VLKEQLQMDVKSENNVSAEFDLYADDYHQQHKANIAITGEEPDYFSEYKVADFAQYFSDKENPKTILDFGSGIGNSIQFLRKYFPNSELYCADVSARSIEISKSRFPGNETYLQIGDEISMPDQSFDAIFTACVFHHIPHEEHAKWLSELRRLLRPNGVMAVYEHNPLNPLTVHAVNTCPLDVNARLIRARDMRKRILENGWQYAVIDYKLFFPSTLKLLRPLEKYLRKFFLGAQWRLIAKK